MVRRPGIGGGGLWQVSVGSLALGHWEDRESCAWEGPPAVLRLIFAPEEQHI